MMNLWKKISLGMLISIFLISGIIFFLINTTKGLCLLFNTINFWIPGLINIDQISGNWHDLCLKNICYRQPGVEVSVDELHLSTSFPWLRRSHFHINNLLLKNVNVAIDSKLILQSEQMINKENNKKLFSILCPITLNHIALNNINISIDNNITIEVVNLISSLHWYQSNLLLKSILLKKMLIAFPSKGEIAQEKNPQLNIQNLLHFNYQKGESFYEITKKFFSKPAFQKIIGTHLPINLDIREFKGEQLRLTGDIDFVVHSMFFSFRDIDYNTYLNTLNINSNQGTVNVIDSTQFHGNWLVNIALNGVLNNSIFQDEKIKLKVNGISREKLQIDMILSGPVDMALRAKINLAESGLPLNVNIVSKQLFWPFTGKKKYQADNLKLELKGKVTNYVLSFYATIKGENTSRATIILDAKGNNQQLNFNKLTLLALEGKTELTMLFDWHRSLSWHGKLKFTNINIKKEIPDWPLKLNGLMRTQGIFYNGGWQVDIPMIKITGNIRKHKVDIKGELKGNSYFQWSIPGLDITLGRNNVNIKGKLGIKDHNLNIAINVPHIDDIVPETSGKIKGLITANNATDDPRILANITASNLHWQEWFINKISISSDIRSTNQIGGKLNIRIKHVTKSGVNIDFVTLDAKGDKEQHDLRFRIESNLISGQLYLMGEFSANKEHWKGRLSNAYFNTIIGLWELSQPITFNYYSIEKKISIEPHCWNNPNAGICVSQTANIGAKSHMVVDLNCINLAMLKPFIPDTTQVSGMFNSKVDITWDFFKRRLSQGSMELSGHDVKLVQVMNSVSIPITFNTLELKVNLNNSCTEFSWLICLTNDSQCKGQIQMTNSQRRRHINGNIHIHNFNIATTNTTFFFGKRSKVSGMLDANLKLVGDILSPRILGQLQFKEIYMDGDFMPFEMQPSQLIINFNGMSSILQGQIRTRQGLVNLSGSANWNRINNWHVHLLMKGSRMHIAMSPMLRLDISPNIRVEMTPDLLNLGGHIDVPWARIVIHKLPKNTVSTSVDEVMINKNLKSIEPKNANILTSGNLSVHIGNDVRMDAFGLKARLTGDLKVIKDKQGGGVDLNGQINIPDGRFCAYGQDLLVRKGELLFFGPLNQPLLNIEVIRNPKAMKNNIIAGVRITGTIDEPKTEVFSDPIMPQQEALFYLLHGQGIDSSQSDSITMTSTLVGLGIAQSGKILGKIGRTFGVNNLALDTQGVGDSSQVVISGYLLPDLQVKYGVGIFDSLATFTLRYRLIPNLYIEVISGVHKALNFLYQFEF